MMQPEWPAANSCPVQRCGPPSHHYCKHAHVQINCTIVTKEHVRARMATPEKHVAKQGIPIPEALQPSVEETHACWISICTSNVLATARVPNRI